MLTDRYLSSTKNLPTLFTKIQEGTAPEKFTIAHLRGIGFTSSNDNAFIPLLKALGFLSDDGTPSPRYHSYRDRSQGPYVLGEAIKEVYEEIFHINESPSEKDREAIKGKFKTSHNATDRVAEQQTATFFALLALAKFGENKVKKPEIIKEKIEEETDKESTAKKRHLGTALHYNIQIHLPATKDIETYNAIFKALREHILDE